MPIYEYECPDCGQRFEHMQKITEESLSSCPKCGGQNVQRLVSASAFHLKGSGWYKNDYSKNEPPSESKKSTDSSAASDSGSEKSSSKESKSPTSSTSSESKNEKSGSSSSSTKSSD